MSSNRSGDRCRRRSRFPRPPHPPQLRLSAQNQCRHWDRQSLCGSRICECSPAYPIQGRSRRWLHLRKSAHASPRSGSGNRNKSSPLRTIALARSRCPHDWVPGWNHRTPGCHCRRPDWPRQPEPYAGAQCWPACRGETPACRSRMGKPRYLKQNFPQTRSATQPDLRCTDASTRTAYRSRRPRRWSAPCDCRKTETDPVSEPAQSCASHQRRRR